MVGFQFKGKARGYRPGVQNSWERGYQSLLENQKIAKEIKYFAFEGIKLRLADRTFYTPDFMVVRADDVIEFHEVKGFMREDAAVKIKVAAEIYPFPFKLVRKVKGKWEVEEV